MIPGVLAPRFERPTCEAMTVGLRLVFADLDDPVYGVFGGGTDQEGCRFHGSQKASGSRAARQAPPGGQ